MKKIILIALSCIMLLSIFVISASARNEDNYTYVLAFNQNEKAYPIMNNSSDAIGFFEYYQTDNINVSLVGVPEYNEGVLLISGKRESFQISYISFSGDRPTFDYHVDNPLLYNDFSIVYLDGAYYLYGFKNGEVEAITCLDSISGGLATFDIYTTSKNDLTNHYVEFPTPPEIVEENDDFISIIIFTLGAFIAGIGTTFGGAFSALFLTNGALNSLAIFLLVFCGISLAIGIVYYITKTVSKKGE